MKNLDKKKRFENPELEVIYFEGDLNTDLLVQSGDFENPGNDDGDILHN